MQPGKNRKHLLLPGSARVAVGVASWSVSSSSLTWRTSSFNRITSRIHPFYYFLAWVFQRPPPPIRQPCLWLNSVTSCCLFCSQKVHFSPNPSTFHPYSIISFFLVSVNIVSPLHFLHARLPAGLARHTCGPHMMKRYPQRVECVQLEWHVITDTGYWKVKCNLGCDGWLVSAVTPNPGMQDVWVDPIHFLWRTGEVARDGRIQTLDVNLHHLDQFSTCCKWWGRDLGHETVAPMHVLGEHANSTHSHWRRQSFTCTNIRKRSVRLGKTKGGWN